jgi:hypothetical protein
MVAANSSVIELIFDQVFDPFPELFDFTAWEDPDRLLDFLDVAAHRHEFAVCRAFQSLSRSDSSGQRDFAHAC